LFVFENNENGDRLSTKIATILETQGAPLLLAKTSFARMRALL
jgi:hypothetical protein